MSVHGHAGETAADQVFEYRSVEKKRLKLAMVLTGGMMAVEVVGGLLSHSLALLSDAGHMFTHFFALAVSFGAILCAGLPACGRRSFGFYRTEILAALLNSVFLLAATGWIIIEAVRRILHPAPVLEAQMFFVALTGLAVNLITIRILWGQTDDLNVRSAFIHMWADTFSSVAVLAGAAVIRCTGWVVIDPLLSGLIAAFIVAWGWGLLRDSVDILMESTPRGIDSGEVARTLKDELPVIEEIGDLHIWEITSKMYSLTCRVKLKGEPGMRESREILSKIKRILGERFKIGHTTIEMG